MSDLLVRDARDLDGRRLDVLICDGVIVSSGAVSSPASDVDEIDAGGALAVPAFVESHLHLDKALLGTVDGGLDAAIAATAVLKRGFTQDDVSARADRVLTWALTAGTTAVRAHTEIDPTVGHVGVDALLDVRERWGDLLRLQIAAFPQEGLEARPGTRELLVDALDHPDVVVGGCPYVEADAAAARRHIDTVLDLAAERGASADLHLDLADHLEDERFVLAEYVARGVIGRDLHGRVAIGHATTLGLLAPLDRARVLDALAEARITVTILPATDLFLLQRDAGGHPFRGLAPARELRAAGVPVALSSNNIRNGFTPTGRADPLDIGLLFARVAHASSDADTRWILDMITGAGRRVVDPDAVIGLEAGAAGDLVLLGGIDETNLLSAPPTSRIVVRAGRVVARTCTQTEVAVSPRSRSSRP